MYNNPQVDPMDNAAWISDEGTPDPAPLPEVLGWRLLLRPVAIRPKTKGGIVLPDIVKDDMLYLNTVARVLAVGPLAFKQEDYEYQWVKVGDYVLYGKNAGKRISYKGVKLVVIEERDLILKIESPNLVDPSY